MIRIGAINIDTSHPLAFCEYLHARTRARYVAVYNNGFRGNDEVEAFISRFGLEKRCNSIEELAETVDIGFVQSCNWDNHLAQVMPFLSQNKPVFIDKPIAGNLADCRCLEELAAKGKVILGSSSLRYAQEIVAFANKPESERGKILNVFATAGVDEFNYAIHVVELIGGLAGTGATSCRFAGRSEADGKACETYFVRFKNGLTATFNTFQGAWQPFEVVIMTTQSTFQFRIDTTRIYAAILDRICDFMETGKNSLAPMPALTEAVKIMLAGRISRSREGAEIALADIPANDPGFDGADFERQYAEQGRKNKLYLQK
ncbi:MAG: Gfo/Idh/MocA family oxidoreductase [Verrucomicrobiae bacterium]|nr:Gfo/Idh/MocA family oxidoreductase [Verrucomicrobiae bacterium]